MPRIAMPRMRSNDVTRSFWETGADREVGIQGQDHHLIHRISFDVGHGRFRERVPIAHGHVGGGLDSPLTQDTLQLPRLLLRDPAQR